VGDHGRPVGALEVLALFKVICRNPLVQVSSRDWDTCVEFNVGFYDCIMGICPSGHRHIVG
jgi:hypothetical protein